MKYSKLLFLFVCIVLLTNCATNKIQFSDNSNNIVKNNTSKIEHTFYLMGDAGNSNLNEVDPTLIYLEA